MFKYDFIILYEHRNRELENAVLLAMMLEKKGYKVAIEHRRSAKILFQKADVIIAPFLYNNEWIINFAFQPFFRCQKIINMQYEQVFQKIDEEKLGNLPDQKAKMAIHISWGHSTTERYKKLGINPSNIFEIGHISMDLNTPKYRDVFLDKGSISKLFNISTERKWLLFISSFSCVGITKAELERWKTQAVGSEYIFGISSNSQSIILDYFEKIANTHPEIIVIYRPHPHESTNKRLHDLEKKYDNFRVISSYSIRQWIIAADYVSTWCSTSLVDVLYAQKKCAIIRPIPFLEEYDYPIYRDQHVISNYEELEDFIKNPDDRYSINSKTIKKYYCNDLEASSFEKMCGVCIQVKKDKKYSFNYFKAIQVSPLKLLRAYIYRILLFFAEFVDYSKFVPEIYHEDILYGRREMYKYKKEIEFYRKRFSKILENEEA